MGLDNSAPSKSQSTRELQKLQRALVHGLEDVKAKNISLFDTEALSSLFERVAIATGSSNRQTKALAHSVSEAVREAGFPKPRIEGEASGEWIIVDCGAAVVHIMQEQVREYYQLESLWGDKPVRWLGANKKAVSKAVAAKSPVEKNSAKKAAVTAPAKTATTKAPVKVSVKTPAKAASTSKTVAAKAVTKKAPANAKSVATKTLAKKAATKK